jgi:hypothetical protein
MNLPRRPQPIHRILLPQYGHMRLHAPRTFHLQYTKQRSANISNPPTKKSGIAGWAMPLRDQRWSRARSVGATLFALGAGRAIAAFFLTRGIRTAFFALGFVGTADLLAGAVGGALLLLQCVLERFHFTGEALHLVAEFVHVGVIGLASFLWAAG